MVEAGLHWRRSLEAVQLSRCVHLWCLVVRRNRSIRASSIAVGHASAVAWDWLLVQCERVEVCAGYGRWLRSKIEDPNNLLTRQFLSLFQNGGRTYANHGENDVSCCRRVRRCSTLIDQAIRSGCCDDDTDCKVADNSDVVCLDSIGCDDDEDADDTGQHPHRSEPCVVWEYVVDIGQYLSNQGDNPSQLNVLLACCLHFQSRSRTHDRYRDGGQREGIADNVLHAHTPLATSRMSTSAIHHMVRVHGVSVHFVERGRV